MALILIIENNNRIRGMLRRTLERAWDERTVTKIERNFGQEIGSDMRLFLTTSDARIPITSDVSIPTIHLTSIQEVAP